MSPPPHRSAREPGVWRWAGLLVALLLAAALGAWLLPPDGVLGGCERDGHFQRMGQVACGLTPINAPYGPLLPWLGAALTSLVGTPYLAGRLLGLISLLGMVALTWRAALRFGAGAGMAALAAALVALNPHLLLYGTRACTDMPATVLWLLALYLAATAVESPGGGRRAAVAGIFGALCALTRVQLLLPTLVLGALVGVLGGGRARVRLGRTGLFMAGAALPIGIAVVLGLRHYPDLRSVLVVYLGWQAFAWAIPRLGVLASGQSSAPGSAGLALRVAWGAWLAVRVSGGLPLLGLAAALWLGLRRRVRPWRAALLLALSTAAYWACTAWSHPPPDLGARRFFLALAPAGMALLAVLATGLRGRLPRWGEALAVGLLLLAGVGFWASEIDTLRGVEPRPAWSGGPALLQPQDRSSQADRAAWDVGRGLVDQGVACVPVYTNYHNATGLFLDARFLTGRPDATVVTDLPGPPPADRAYLLWVTPPDAPTAETPRVEGFTAHLLEREGSASTWLLEPVASGVRP